jgi:hypothetical protein
MSIAATSDGRRVRYGWVVVGVTFLTLLTTAGAMSTPSVLLEPHLTRSNAPALSSSLEGIWPRPCQNASRETRPVRKGILGVAGT